MDALRCVTRFKRKFNKTIQATEMLTRKTNCSRRYYCWSIRTSFGEPLTYSFHSNVKSPQRESKPRSQAGFVRANREKSNLVTWRQTLTTSPPNHIRFLLVRAKKCKVENGLHNTQTSVIRISYLPWAITARNNAIVTKKPPQALA